MVENIRDIRDLKLELASAWADHYMNNYCKKLSDLMVDHVKDFPKA